MFSAVKLNRQVGQAEEQYHLFVAKMAILNGDETGAATVGGSDGIISYML